MTLTRKQRTEINNANIRANRAADALRYLNAAVGCASEAGVDLVGLAVMRTDLMKQLDQDAKITGFKASEFYSEK